MSASAFLTQPGNPFSRFARWLAGLMPKGLYARSLIIIIAPVVLLQSVIAYVFMERHWQLVTRRLSSAVTADIAALIDIYETYPQDKDGETLGRIAGDRLALDVDILKDAELPPPGPKPFFSILDEALSDEIRRQIARPYWTDTVGRSNFIEIRVKLKDGVMRVIARRSQAYASNSHIFLLWMGGSSLVLLGIAILFLRNQIRPILRLAEVAEGFGKGRDIEFRPRGAREVRQAGHAFIEMKERIERAMEQRTAMLNGVSHDLRTILTRFKLSLALVEQTAEVEALKKDIDEMSRMLEGYLAFARGDAGEQAVTTDLRTLLSELQSDAERQGDTASVDIVGDPMVTVRQDAFRRLLFNLVSNAARHGTNIAIRARHDGDGLVVHVDDDGPGIPPEAREDVFKPFVRLD
ncbi:MAG TPA: ATP-binding protein, partial [Beijerinckiaceae bacterium]|nr:ATP-binding protein [Beijerinckiaceae bacterium]